MNGSSCRDGPISIFTYLPRILQPTYVGSIYRKYEASYWLYNNISQKCNFILSPGLSICLGVIPNELDEPGKPPVTSLIQLTPLLSFRLIFTELSAVP